MTNVQKLPLLAMMAIIAIAVIIGIASSTEAQDDANGVDSQMTYGNAVLQQLQQQLAGTDPLLQQQIWQQIPNFFPYTNIQATGGVVDQFGNFRPPVADYQTGLDYIRSSQGVLDRMGGLNPDYANFLTGQNYVQSSDGLLDAFGILNPNVADFRTGLQQIESSQGVLDRQGNLVPGTFHLGQLNAINNPYALAWSWTNPFDPGDYTPPPQRPQYQPNQMQRTFAPQQRPQAQVPRGQGYDASRFALSPRRPIGSATGTDRPMGRPTLPPSVTQSMRDTDVAGLYDHLPVGQYRRPPGGTENARFGRPETPRVRTQSDRDTDVTGLNRHIPVNQPTVTPRAIVPKVTVDRRMPDRNRYFRSSGDFLSL